MTIMPVFAPDGPLGEFMKMVEFGRREARFEDFVIELPELVNAPSAAIDGVISTTFGDKERLEPLRQHRSSLRGTVLAGRRLRA